MLPVVCLILRTSIFDLCTLPLTLAATVATSFLLSIVFEPQVVCHVLRVAVLHQKAIVANMYTFGSPNIVWGPNSMSSLVF